MPVTTIVNGMLRESLMPTDTPLLYVLRNEFGLFGTRYGCGANQCGACHVLVDGHPLAACDTPLWSVENKTVTTMEGLGTPQRPHPIQTALLAEQAGQCGYCLGGIAVTAAALLSRNPRPTRSEIRESLDKNLCRCGSHNRIVRAIEQAARAIAGSPA
jgi:nicotinate dehydrogenase subunit A